jgi:hypothetical protein
MHQQFLHVLSLWTNLSNFVNNIVTDILSGWSIIMMIDMNKGRWDGEEGWRNLTLSIKTHNWLFIKRINYMSPAIGWEGFWGKSIRNNTTFVRYKKCVEKLTEILYCRRITMYILVERFFIMAAVKVHCMIIRLDKLQIIVHANEQPYFLSNIWRCVIDSKYAKFPRVNLLVSSWNTTHTKHKWLVLLNTTAIILDHYEVNRQFIIPHKLWSY